MNVAKLRAVYAFFFHFLGCVTLILKADFCATLACGGPNFFPLGIFKVRVGFIFGLSKIYSFILGLIKIYVFLLLVFSLLNFLQLWLVYA